MTRGRSRRTGRTFGCGSGGRGMGSDNTIPPPALPPLSSLQPEPAPVNHNTCIHILVHSTVIFFYHLPAFLLLSAAVFLIRHYCEQAFGAMIEDNESLKQAILYRIWFPCSRRILHWVDSNTPLVHFYNIGLLVFLYYSFVLTFTLSIVSVIVYYQVRDNICGTPKSFLLSVYDGVKVGYSSVLRFGLCKFAIRSVFAMYLSNYIHLVKFRAYIYKIVPHDIDKIFLEFLENTARAMCLPIANLAQWDTEYTFFWIVFDFPFRYFNAVVPWIAIEGPNLRYGENTDVGLFMMASLLNVSPFLAIGETIICGPIGRWMMRRAFGGYCSLALQSVMEVYFMVVWLVFYFSARNVANSFGHAEAHRFLKKCRKTLSSSN